MGDQPAVSAEVAGSVAYNETDWDLLRSNTAVSVASSAAQSGTTNHTFTNHNARALLVIVDATASSGDGTEDLDIHIELQDPASSKWVTIISDASALTNGGTGTLLYGVGAGLGDTQTSLQAFEEIPAPRDLRVRTVVQQGGASPDYTYSVGVHLVR